MKNYIKFKIWLAVSVLGFFTFGCADQLEIEPRQSIGENIALTDYQGVQNALIGAWDGLQDAEFLGANIIMHPELMTRNMIWGGSYVNFTEIANKQIIPNNASTQPFWMMGFQAIDRANKIIDVVDAGTVNDPLFETHKNRLKGNALVIRAIAHFELVKAYSHPWGYTADNSHLGVPVIISGTYTPANAENVSRETVANVYARVIEDLTAAVTLLPESYAKPFPTKNVAKALLARVYLEKRDWTNAAKFAGEVIEEEAFSLNADPSAFYSTPYTDESIMEVAHTSSDNPRNTRDDLANYWSPYEREDITIPLSAINKFEDTDKRKDIFFSIVDGETTSWFTSKYMAQEDNVPYYRYAELLLIRAEALAMLNPSDVPQEAVDILEDIRERANATHVVPASADELLQAIRLEREKELMHEGKYFFDQLRWRTAEIGFAISSNTATLNWDNARMIFPVPQREMDVNPNLEQNPGY